MTVAGMVMKRFGRCEGGNAPLEAALVLPVALLVFAGMADLGRAYMAVTATEISMRSAARYLSQLPSSAVCGSWGQTKAKNIAVYGNASGSGQPVAKGLSTAHIAVTKPASCASTDGIIQLDATVPFSGNLLPMLGMSNTLSLKATHQERWIGQ